MGNLYDHTVICQGGTQTTLDLYDGDVANNTTVDSGGTMAVSSGGTANSTTVNSSGSIDVFSGGTANNTIVSSGGYLSAHGGTADSTIVSSGGKIWIGQDGYAPNTEIRSGGNINGFIAQSDTILSEGVHLSGMLVNARYADLYYGQTATSTTLVTNAYLSVRGIVSSSIVSGGQLRISSGGTANNTTVNSGGYLFVYSGGTATNAVIASGGKMGITLASNTLFQGTSYGSAFEYRTFADRIAIYPGDSLTIGEGGTANFIVVNRGASVFVSSGGTANSATVYSSGYISIDRGGTANSTTVSSGGSMTVSSGGTANSTTVSSGGSMTVSSGGTANSTTVSSGGSMTVSSGGSANNTTVNWGGSMTVSSGGTANSTTVYMYGSMTVNSGGTANSTTVNSKGWMFVHQSGTANSATVSSGGSMSVLSDGTANETIVSSGGSLLVSAGGTANDTTVDNGGFMRIFVGGTANDTIVGSGGSMSVFSGGVITGTLDITSGATVSFESGSILNFDLVSRAEADTALVNDYSLISGTPDISITISTAELEEISFITYALADNAASFAETVTLKTEDDTVLGTLSVGTVLDTDDFSYILTDTDGCLALGILNKERNQLVVPYRFEVHDREDALVINWEGEENSTYRFRYGESPELSGDGEALAVKTKTFDPADLTVGQTYYYQVRAVNPAGTESGWSFLQTFSVHEFLQEPETREDQAGNIQTGWADTADKYTAQYTNTATGETAAVDVTANRVNVIGLNGSYTWHAAECGSERWTGAQSFTSAAPEDPVQYVSPDSTAEDVFFARTDGVFSGLFVAKNMTTGEYKAICGMNRFTDMFAGGETNISTLYLTDEGNDAFFLEDVYSASPGGAGQTEARIANVNMIHAGAGDDLIDLTSRRFAESGGKIGVHGGNGDDTVWGGDGDGSMLFGDLGNDTVKGGTGNDFIIGGYGDDMLYGNGGDDTFLFGAEVWGTDQITQEDGGTVRLWFAAGDESNWDALTMTYTDGGCSVTVVGVAADNVTLKFGADETDPDFAALADAGAFGETGDRTIYTVIA